MNNPKESSNVAHVERRARDVLQELGSANNWNMRFLMQKIYKIIEAFQAE